MKIIFLIGLICILLQSTFAAQKIKLPELLASRSFKVEGNIILPSGQKLNKGAPSNVTVLEKNNGQWQEVAKIKLAEVFAVSEIFPYSFSILTQAENSELKVKAGLYHCDKVKNNFCVIDDFEGELKRNLKSKIVNLELDLKGSPPR